MFLYKLSRAVLFLYVDGFHLSAKRLTYILIENTRLNIYFSLSLLTQNYRYREYIMHADILLQICQVRIRIKPRDFFLHIIYSERVYIRVYWPLPPSGARHRIEIYWKTNISFRQWVIVIPSEKNYRREHDNEYDSGNNIYIYICAVVVYRTEWLSIFGCTRNSRQSNILTSITRPVIISAVVKFPRA